MFSPFATKISCQRLKPAQVPSALIWIKGQKDWLLRSYTPVCADARSPKCGKVDHKAKIPHPAKRFGTAKTSRNIVRAPSRTCRQCVVESSHALHSSVQAIRRGNGPLPGASLLLAQRRSSLKLMASFNRSRGFPARSIIEGRP